MDGNGVWRFPEGSGRQGRVERYCCNVICGVPTTSKVKGLRWDESRWYWIYFSTKLGTSNPSPFSLNDLSYMLCRIPLHCHKMQNLHAILDNSAASWHNQQNGMCAQRRLRSDWAVRMKRAWVLSYPLSAQRRLWSDLADAQADLSLRWAHIHFVGFAMRLLNICTVPLLTNSKVNFNYQLEKFLYDQK